MNKCFVYFLIFKHALAGNEKQISDGEKQLAAAEAELAENEEQISAGEEQLAAARKQMLESGLDEETINAQPVQQEQALAEARQQLEAGKAELTAKKEELANGRKQLEAGKAELAAKKAELKEGRKQLEAGKAELAAKKQELADGRAKLESGKQELADGRKELNDGKTELEESKEIYEKPMTAEELADVMEEVQSDVEEMLKIRRMTMLDVENDKMELEEFVDFIIKEVLTNETYADAITDDMRKELEDGQKEIANNKELMLGEEYNRMMVSLALPIEGDKTFSFIGKL